MGSQVIPLKFLDLIIFGYEHDYKTLLTTANIQIKEMNCLINLPKKWETIPDSNKDGYLKDILHTRRKMFYYWKYAETERTSTQKPTFEEG